LSEMTWMIAAVLALWAGIVMLRRRRESMQDGPQQTRKQARAGDAKHDDDDGIDYAELEAAEREVRDLDTDAKGRPLDEGVGDDWGPGTPKPPYA
jgi:hypothetical protein